jgi:hypothetical protein
MTPPANTFPKKPALYTGNGNFGNSLSPVSEYRDSRFFPFRDFRESQPDRDKTATKDRDRTPSTFGENHHAYRIRI